MRSLLHKIKTEANAVQYFFKILTISNQRRYAIPWWRSRKPGYLIASSMPWICFDAIIFLNDCLRTKNNLRIFEYGSGGSTFYWLLFDVKLVSIEHDISWFTMVKEKLNTRMIKNVDYRYVEPEYVNENWWKERDPSDPLQYSTGDETLKNYKFRNYVNQIDQFPDGYFDLIMIDGRSRPACITHSIKKVKQGGLLIIDNTEIDYYFQKTASYLEAFDRKIFFGIVPTLTHMSRTDIFLAK